MRSHFLCFPRGRPLVEFKVKDGITDPFTQRLNHSPLHIMIHSHARCL